MSTTPLPIGLRSLGFTERVWILEALMDQAGREGWTHEHFLRTLCDVEVNGLRGSHLQLGEHFGLAPQSIHRVEPHAKGAVVSAQGALKQRLKPPVLWRGDPDGDPAKTSRRFLAEVFHPAQGAWPPWRIKAWVVRHPGREALWPEYVAEDGLVNRWSAVPTNRRVYSAPNRGRGEIVRRGRYEEGVEVYRGDVRPRVIPRLTGERRHAIHHGPIPQGWWRQPTALAPDRFPTDRFFSLVFRQVYDRLGRDRVPRTADWDSLGLLRQAVHTMESKLEQALWELAARHLTSRGTTLPQFWPTPSPMAPPDPPPRRVDRAIYNKRLTEEPQ